MTETIAKAWIQSSHPTAPCIKPPGSPAARLAAHCSAGSASPADSPAEPRGCISQVLVEGLPEILQLIFRHLDCEGVRKLAAASRTIRNTSFRALAIAEFEASQIRLKGAFQAFQVSALRDGRRAWGAAAASSKAFRAAIDEVQLRSGIRDDLAFMELVASRSFRAPPALKEDKGAAGPGLLSRCTEDREGVRLPGAAARRISDELLSDRERRLLALGERVEKPVVCTFNVSKTHAGAQSGRCAGCARYACAPCGDLAACSCCAQTFCRACKALEPCAACGDGACPACWAAAAEQQRCMQCPVFAKVCAQCRPVGHCQVCDAHGGKGSRACDSCGGESCAVCVAESPYCRLCGEFCMW